MRCSIVFLSVALSVLSFLGLGTCWAADQIVSEQVISDHALFDPPKSNEATCQHHVAVVTHPKCDLHGACPICPFGLRGCEGPVLPLGIPFFFGTFPPLGCGCDCGCGLGNGPGGGSCECHGSYKYPVPSQYTYHWAGIYSQQTMTQYVSPYRNPGLNPIPEAWLNEKADPTSYPKDEWDADR
jgi:hypothetical protein